MTRIPGAQPDPMFGMQRGSVAPPAAASRDEAAIEAKARDFEAMTIDQMLKPMFDTEDDTDDVLGGGQAEAMLKPMLVTQFAHLMEDRGGFGLSDAIRAALDARKGHA